MTFVSTQPSASQSLRLRRAARGPAVVVSVAGELDMLTAPALHEQISIAESEVIPPAVVVLDLTGVSFLASAGLNVFAEHDQRCTLAGNTLRLVLGGNTGVRRLLRITNLDADLTVVDTLEQAVQPV